MAACDRSHGLTRPYGLSQEVVDKLLGVFTKHPRVEKVLVYGSRAKGGYRKASDIDLTMQGEQLQWADQQQIEQEIDELLLPYQVDLSIYHQIDNPELIEHIKRWGKSLL